MISQIQEVLLQDSLIIDRCLQGGGKKIKENRVDCLLDGHSPFNLQSARDPSGASIALYTAKLHHPNKTGNHVVLQALFYLLDQAVER